MLTRQESSLSSSRRQSAATPPPRETHHAKAIGCMSGIFQLFSKYQNPSKRLTFGKKQEKCKKPSSPRKTKPPELKTKEYSVTSTKEDKLEKLVVGSKKLSCEVNEPNRSPAITPEIRRSNASSGSPRTPSSLVARLMGLEDMKGTNDQGIIEEDPIAEKRRRLLHALEKCNEDLESLKRIIKSVQSSDVRIQQPRSPAAKRLRPGGGCGGDIDSWGVKLCEKKWAEVGAAEELSPVCVLDEFTRSPVNKLCKDQKALVRAPLHRGKPHTSSKKPGEEDEPITKHLFLNKSTTIFSTADNIPSAFQMRRLAAVAVSQPWRSRAMVQSVEEVSSDISCGEKREVGRIGQVLEDHLFKDLVEELIKELKNSRFVFKPVLPLEACKRRLCF